MAEPSNRTFVCSVLFLDIVEYSRQSVSEQQRLKQRFNTLLGKAMRPVPSRERVTVDTGDGAAVAFLGNPEDAVQVATTMRDAALAESDNLLKVRCGLNLGPVRLVKDINGRQNLIGDGINVAQRIMDFADTGQILASRSFVEVVSHLSEDYASLFSYQGQRTDKHSREHRLYSVAKDRIATAGGERTASTAGGAAAARVRRPLNRRALVAAALLFVLPIAGAVALRLVLKSERWSQARVAVTASARDEAHEKTPSAEDQPATSEKSAPQTPPAEKAAAPAAHEQEQSKVSPSAPLAPRASAPAKVEPAPARVERAPAKTEPAPTRIETAPPVVTAPSRPANGNARGVARIKVTVLPWGEVFVDGRSRGISPPPKTIEVAPGKHVVEFRNSDLPRHVERVELKAGEQVEISYRFD